MVTNLMGRRRTGSPSPKQARNLGKAISMILVAFYVEDPIEFVTTQKEKLNALVAEEENKDEPTHVNPL